MMTDKPLFLSFINFAALKDCCAFMSVRQDSGGINGNVLPHGAYLLSFSQSALSLQIQPEFVHLITQS